MSLSTASPYLTRALLRPEPVSAEIAEPDEWGDVELRVGRDCRALGRVPTYRLFVDGNFEGPLYLTHAQLCALAAAADALTRPARRRVTRTGRLCALAAAATLSACGGGGADCPEPAASVPTPRVDCATRPELCA
jgi:hypothetical protein